VSHQCPAVLDLFVQDFTYIFLHLSGLTGGHNEQMHGTLTPFYVAPGRLFSPPTYLMYGARLSVGWAEGKPTVKPWANSSSSMSSLVSVGAWASDGI
jgi:hypothetical protein